jgi:hypothetical protein
MKHWVNWLRMVMSHAAAARSFNKILFPALRIAYAIVPEPLVGAFVDAKHVADGHNASLTQGVLAAFISEGHLRIAADWSSALREPPVLRRAQGWKLCGGRSRSISEHGGSANATTVAGLYPQHRSPIQRAQNA